MFGIVLDLEKPVLQQNQTRPNLVVSVILEAEGSGGNPSDSQINTVQ